MAQGGRGGGVEAPRLLLLRRRRLAPSAPWLAGSAIGPERLGLADFLIGEPGFGTAADDALVGRLAPFDAVILIEDAFGDRRARAAVRKDGEGLVWVGERGRQSCANLPGIDGAMAPPIGPLRARVPGRQ